MTKTVKAALAALMLAGISAPAVAQQLSPPVIVIVGCCARSGEPYFSHSGSLTTTAGAVPIGYQPALLDPLGRINRIDGNFPALFGPPGFACDSHIIHIYKS